MRLADFKPRWCNAVDGDHGIGVEFDCPCGCSSRCFVPFKPALDGGPGDERGWARIGETFETLTLTPSIHRIKPCGWHGFITNGGVTSC